MKAKGIDAIAIIMVNKLKLIKTIKAKMHKKIEYIIASFIESLSEANRDKLIAMNYPGADDISEVRFFTNDF
mgnify:CR=1 FL=1